MYFYKNDPILAVVFVHIRLFSATKTHLRDRIRFDIIEWDFSRGGDHHGDGVGRGLGPAV